ncbi:response regulator [Changchengzhania lutea]|uniref:response regulator n=1 Tax=Changchengzhania lutea TaxID=2049305 RepID=UPI00115CE427|nr:response regulator [Changchengzhania lutea]
MINDILLIDDHPIILNAYENAITKFAENNTNFQFKIYTAICCESALNLINNRNKPFNYVFLDIRLPKSKGSKFQSGKDIGLELKKRFPKTKIVVITGHFDTFTLDFILQYINPHGLLFKGDIVANTVSEALKSAFKNEPFYSITILKLLRKKISSNIILSKVDKLLLSEISKGTKTKDLVKILPLSIGGVEKRKRHLRELFDTLKGNDLTLINAAKEKGFV